jgi:uncharacterized lipoprotein YmbA
LPLLAGAAIAACASAPTRVLVALPPSAAPEQRPGVSAASLAPRVLLVRRLVIPEYMAAPKIRYWSGPATLAEWPDTYWGERVEIGMAREFVSALRRRLPGWTVCDASCGDTPVDLTLKVELLRLDAWRHDRSLSASSQAELSGRKSATLPSQGGPWARSFTLPLAADTAQGQARAISDLLAALADTSVAAIQDVQPVRRAGSGAPP